MTEQNKKIVGVEILHLDELGYGPEGKHTRRQWRKLCYESLLQGIGHLNQFQTNAITSPYRGNQDFGYIVEYDNNEKIEIKLVLPSSTFDFVNQTFDKYLSFEDFTFKTSLVFDHASFAGEIDFTKCVFEKSTYFGNVLFSKEASFTESKFIQSTFFKDSNFQDRAYFWAVQFLFNVMFDRSNFRDVAIFTLSEFKKICWFKQVTFSKAVFFESSSFIGVGTFEDTKFEKFFPNFRGCKIDSTRIEFTDVDCFPRNSFSSTAINNISFLKRLADEHGQTDQALNFNAMELRAKRKLAFQSLKPSRHDDAIFLKTHLSWRVWIVISGVFKGRFWFWFFTLLYEKCSDFGRSYTRPLFLLMALNLITFLLCISIASQQGNEPEQTLYASLNEAKAYGEKDKVRITAFRAASEYSIYKTGNFLDFSDTDKHTEIINQRLFGSVIEPSGMRFYGFIKGLLSAILIFLIGLGIRNKYRVS